MYDTNLQIIVGYPSLMRQFFNDLLVNIKKNAIFLEFSCGYNEKLSMQRRNLRDDFKVRQGVDKQFKNGDGQ